MRILLLNLGPESAQEVNQALSGQGYEIITGRGLTVEKILALFPEVLITEATPSDLSCCGVISQIKASPDPRTPRILMIVHGGALERARALDLGADDVISFPFEWRNPATGGTPAPRRTGACVPDRKRRVGNSRVFEGANRRDPQEDSGG